jgi:ribosomal protein S18 acetylase RimI-like enzyme
MNSTSVVPASEVPHAERAALWTEAFSDYYTPGSFTAESLAAFEQAFELDLSGSRVVVDEGKPVAFGMLGVRGRRGWVGGMGVLPSARRRGHGARVMRALIVASRERRVDVLRLEVLVQNDRALPLYESLGFRTTRKFEVWDRAADVAAPLPPSPRARPIPIDEAAERIAALRPERAPWQRELEGVRRGFPDIQALASAGGHEALVVFRASPERIGIVEVAAAPGGPARDAALDQVLATLFSAHPARVARLLNLTEGDPVAPALARAGAVVSHRQWEMELPL